MGIGRWIKHSVTSHQHVRQVLPPAAMERIGAAIARAEADHCGEIRLAVEAALPWSYLRRDAPARQRATMLFAKLRVWDTEANNGVLLYIELADRAIEIVADRGIARLVPQSEWEAICVAIRDRFKAKDYEAGVIAGIEAIGRLLTRHFPLQAGQTNPNELPDRPVVL
jgi:uncharacterized membrane protein